MPSINELIATVGDYGIGQAFSQGQEQGRIRNALAFASRNYATNPQAAANALLELGDVRGATSIMENVRQAEQNRLNRQRQGSLDELNRRNIESEISARSRPQRDLYGERAAAAGRFGLQEGTPEYQAFVLSGNLPQRGQPGNLPSGYRQKEGSTTGEIRPIPGGPGTALPAELAARVGLSNDFLRKVPELEGKIRSTPEKPGVFAGIGGRGALIARTGDAGSVVRELTAGSEAMTRMLTGAGMNQQEAEREVQQYLPAWNDNETTILDKLGQLNRRLKTIVDTAMTGRGGTAAPQTQVPTAQGGATNAGPRKTSTGVQWSVE